VLFFGLVFFRWPPENFSADALAPQSLLLEQVHLLSRNPYLHEKYNTMPE